MDEKLLTREQFRAKVFERDDHLCVFCNLPAVDAHHILERKLWPDGGYYLSNGASVCEDCHWKCETTQYPVSYVLSEAGIEKMKLPPGFEENAAYDKWGNRIVGVIEDSHPQMDVRVPGPLYNDPGFQKIKKESLMNWCVAWLDGKSNYDYTEVKEEEDERQRLD